MAHSLTFNTVDLSTYGLTVNTVKVPVVQEATHAQLANLSRAWNSHKPPKVITLDISVTATSLATLKSYLDSIRGVLNESEDKSLALDFYTDRYWLARFNSLRGSVISPTSFQGVLEFICYDPLAYDNTPITSNHTIDADPDTVIETTGGTGTILPVYTLTAKNNLGAITIKLENLTLNEEIQWTGTLVIDDELEIDAANWLVSLNGTADMATVTGQFPRLVPDQANSIKVTALFTVANASMQIVYRNRYV